MEIKAYLNILMKRLWIIIAIPLLAAVATACVNFFVLEPAYESGITLYVMNKAFDPRIKLAYDDILASQQLIKDCRELIKSKSMTKAVIEQLDLKDITKEELADKITVNLKNDTRILEIKVRDASGVRAKAIVEEVSNVFQKRVRELMKLETLDVIDEAEVPHKPVSPKPLANISIVSFAALFLIISAVLMLEYFDDTLKNSEEVEKLLGIKVIGIIPSLDLE